MIYGNSRVDCRKVYLLDTKLSLNLTDGRVFTSQDAGGALQGSFFNSPYAYNTVIKCIPNAPQAGTYKVDTVSYTHLRAHET